MILNTNLVFNAYKNHVTADISYCLLATLDKKVGQQISQKKVFVFRSTLTKPLISEVQTFLGIKTTYQIVKNTYQKYNNNSFFN